MWTNQPRQGRLWEMCLPPPLRPRYTIWEMSAFHVHGPTVCLSLYEGSDETRQHRHTDHLPRGTVNFSVF